MGRRITFCYVWLALIIVQLGFGAYGVIFVKFAKDHNANPLIFCLIRDGCCFPILFLAGMVAEKRLIVPRLKEFPQFIALGFIGMFCNQLLYVLGLCYTTASSASVLQPVIPIWTAIIAILTRTEKSPPLNKIYGWAKIIGILAATIGAIVMVLVRHTDNKQRIGEGVVEHSGYIRPSLGYIFLIGHTFAMGLYIVLQKRYIFNKVGSQWVDAPITVTAWCYFFGFVFMTFASLYYINSPEKYMNIPKETVIPLIYAIFVTSALCYLLLTWCNSVASATVVTSSWPLQVLFCVILAYYVLDETLQPVQYYCGSLIIVGFLLVLWSNYKEEFTNMTMLNLEEDEEREKLLINQ